MHADDLDQATDLMAFLQEHFSAGAATVCCCDDIGDGRTVADIALSLADRLGPPSPAERASDCLRGAIAEVAEVFEGVHISGFELVCATDETLSGLHLREAVAMAAMQLEALGYEAAPAP